MLKIMKKLYMILMTAVISSVAFLSCTQKEEPFFTASENDAPRILNTDIPDWDGGAPSVLMTISRDQNFEFEIIVTPADYTTVEWFLDDVKIAEGKTINQPVLAGNWTLKMLATTTKGLSAYRIAKLVVNPLAGDPVAGEAILERLVAPGATAALGGTNMDKVAKVVIGGVECDATYASDAVTYTVPADMAAGTYQLTLKDAEEFEYGAGYITVSAASVVSAASFSGKPGAEIVLTGLNLDKVATLTVGDQTCTIVSSAAGELKVTLPALAAGTYELTGLDASGAAVNFINGSQMQESATVIITSEVVLWEGNHYVDWGTPFNAIQISVKEHLAPGRILRFYVNGNGQGAATTSWWNNFTTCQDGEANRGDIMISGEMVLEYTLHADGIAKLNAEDGLFLVGSGYTVTKVTIE